MAELNLVAQAEGVALTLLVKDAQTKAKEAMQDIGAEDFRKVVALAKHTEYTMIVVMCVVFLRPLGIEDAEHGWAGAKVMLKNPNLRQSLIDYELQPIEVHPKMHELEKLLKRLSGCAVLRPDERAIHALLQWVRAVVELFHASTA